jgi:trigger factor
LGDYTELRVPFEESEVTEADLESALEELRQNRALIEPADRPAQMEDVVTLDLYAELLEPGEDENPLVLDRKGMEFVLTDDSDWPFPGFADQVIGMSVDDERSVEHTFAEDYPVERLRARAARFDLKCLEVKSRLVPEWTDDLARGMGEFEDLLDLRLKLRENLEENAQQQAEGAYLELVIQTLLERAEIMYPPVLLEAELDELVAEFSRRLAGQNLTLEDYMQIEKTDLETVRSELEPQAKERLARALALGKIVDLEEFDVDENEISAELDRMVAPFEDQGAELRKAFDHPEGRRRIRLDLLTNKAIKHLVAIAKGEGGIKPAPQAETTMTSEGEPAAAEPDEPVVGAPDEISEAEVETSEE